MSWGGIRKTIAWLLALGGLSLTVSVNVTINHGPPVPEDELGWRPDLVEEAAPIVAEMPQFLIVGADPSQDNSRANVRLWDAAKRVTGGQHLPNYPQQVGDCVSFGAKNAIEYLQCVNLADGIDFALGGPIARGPPEFRPVYPPYIYGTSRVQIGGGRLRGDGSVGAWAAAAVQQYGVLRSDAPGVPSYSGSVARDWGKSGPPRTLIDEAKRYPVKTVAPVRTPDETRDAIVNGYPVTIASSWGTRNYDIRDGRRVARGDGSWAHQMCLIGYDGTASQPYWYCLNSWGPNAHPAPLQGEPPGGFWLNEASLKKILAARDSFAFSGFDGFPAALDFTVIGDAGPAVSVPQDVSQVTLWRAQVMEPFAGTILGLSIALMGLVLLIVEYRKRLGNSSSAVRPAALVVALAGLAGGNTLAADVVALDFSALEVPVIRQAAPLDFSILTVTTEAAPTLDFGCLQCSSECQCGEDCDCGDVCECGSTAAKPLEATVYGPPDCLACRRMEADVGAGNDALRVTYRHGDPTWFPSFVAVQGAKGGWPVTHYPTPAGWRVRSGAATLDQLVEWCTTAPEVITGATHCYQPSGRHEPYYVDGRNTPAAHLIREHSLRADLLEDLPADVLNQLHGDCHHGTQPAIVRRKTLAVSPRAIEYWARARAACQTCR
jgi:hypothetical protein